MVLNGKKTTLNLMNTLYRTMMKIEIKDTF